MSTIWVLVLVSLGGDSAVRIGGYSTEEACVVQGKVAIEHIKQSGINFYTNWRSICVPVENVTP